MAGSLPLEILQQIFSYESDSLTQYACVCRQWQLAAETFTFAHLHINSADLESFRQILASSHSTGRYFRVRSLSFKVVLPAYSDRARGHYENKDDRDANNRVFTQAIISLFKILSSWPYHDRYQILLQIYARSPSDWQAEPDWIARRARQQRGYAFPEQDLLDRRYERSYLQLTGRVALADARCITSIEVKGSDAVRNIGPAAVCLIVAHLLRLETIIASLRDKERENTKICDTFGSDFSITGWRRSLRQLYLRYKVQAPYSQSLLVPFNPRPNPLCLVLHRLSQQLEIVDLSQIIIGPELFWPVDASNTNPFWPRLTKFTASCSYFPTYGYAHLDKSIKLDENASSVTSDDSVALPHDQGNLLYLQKNRLDEVFVAAGRAAHHMPRLISMEIDIGTLRVPAFDFCFSYDARLGTATWTTFSEFCVSNEVQQAWDLAAKSHGHGQIRTEVFPADSSLSS
ncbi:uncharacterized protein N7500_000331 [Penicillium coprophilum]|uniref:uncharacterized protein n=1 Tax=Penicillium coprophilum TaxID=36646 RepID=UPI0023A30486|nr:uncharacterized protein N7500_000331 [Penicillium coprophilum]KAJ5177632.1 hypothetical protein N7500_000331 [Penicillium coprophilum]